MRVLALGVVAAVLIAGVAVSHGAQEEPRPTREPLPVVPAGVGSLDNVHPSLRRAISLAIAAAARDGVELRVTSGWRSRDKQQRLFEEALAKYGSPERARRWVLPPEESEHVRGGAVDVGPESGARWLAEHGVRFGLCQRYDNEPWHFERLAAAKGSVCPPRSPHP